MGAILAANGFGGATAIQIVGPIIESGVWGYRTAYRLVAVILLITGMLILLFFRENPKGQKKTEFVVEKKKARDQSWIGIEFSEAKKTTFFIWSHFRCL